MTTMGRALELALAAGAGDAAANGVRASVFMSWTGKLAELGWAQAGLGSADADWMLVVAPGT